MIRLWMLCLCCWVMPVQAADSLPQPLLQGLETLAQVHGFSCKFKQVLSYDDGSQQVFEGTLAVARGGHFRWAYHQPYEQLYVSNGHDIWFYEPDLMQAQHLTSLDAIDPMAMRLLEGRVSADEIRVLSEEMEGQQTVYHIQLGAETVLWLALDAQSLPIWFETRDALGNRNRMNLLSLQTGQPDMHRFEFKVPTGVDILDAQGRMMEQR